MTTAREVLQAALAAFPNRYNPSEFELRIGPFEAGILHATKLRGRETLNGLYSFDVEFETPPGFPHGSFDRQMLGERATLQLLAAPGMGRHVHGLVSRVESFGAGPRGAERYRVRIVPAAWLLGRRRGMRIFQEKTVVEIAEALFQPMQAKLRAPIVRRLRQRGYCVQYNETEWGFVQRILAEDGLIFRFDHESDPDQEVMVVIDAPDRYGNLEGLPIHYQDGESGDTAEHIHRFHSSRAIFAGKAVVREFDFTRPGLKASETYDVGSEQRPGEFDARQLEQYRHYDEVEGADVQQGAARDHLDAHRRNALVFRGSGTSRRFTPGVRFRVDWPHAEEFGANEYVVTSVEHVGEAPSEERVVQGRVYENTFTCVPASVPYRPRRPKRRIQQAVETARVVGAGDGSIYTDHFGRIKVQFYWDREGQENEHSSCWIRVAQAWAGAGFGAQFVPRVGMEVLVQFLLGDTDKPIVTGCVYNGENPPPFSLPDQQTKSGFKTHTGADGFHELSFDDTPTGPNIVLKSQGSFQGTVITDRDTHVGGMDRTRVDGGIITQTAGTYVVTCEGANIQTIGRDWNVVARGAIGFSSGSSLTMIAEGDRADSCANHRADVRGSFTGDVHHDASVHVEGRLQLTNGHGIDLMTGETLGLHGMSGDFSFTDTLQAYAARILDVRSAGELRFTVGNSSIAIRPDEIVLQTKKLTLDAHEEATLQGGRARVHLKNDLDLRGDTTVAHGTQSTLRLADNAMLRGVQVNIANALGARASASRGDENETKSDVNLRCAIFIGDTPEAAREGELIVRDGDGTEIHKIHATQAVDHQHGQLLFEVPTKDLRGSGDLPLSLHFKFRHHETHVAGPLVPRRYQRALRDEHHDHAQHMAATRRSHRPHFRPNEDPIRATADHSRVPWWQVSFYDTEKPRETEDIYLVMRHPDEYFEIERHGPHPNNWIFRAFHGARTYRMGKVQNGASYLVRRARSPQGVAHTTGSSVQGNSVQRSSTAAFIWPRNGVTSHRPVCVAMSSSQMWTPCRRRRAWRTGSSFGPDSSTRSSPRRRTRRWVRPRPWTIACRESSFDRSACSGMARSGSAW